ncbi:hypothetical protein PR048_008889 [Dryococelus australis]|uniref:Uncharacterized protein n=1 Tax=Dryococelus australis TaxID=614101 RepID=A0ABQ9HZG5_9NEOP|nr:hypothetical protein PR048_008889 [Dryococelus australis]
MSVVISSYPPPLDDNLYDEEEDEFVDFAAADLSYGLEGEVTLAPKAEDIEAPAAGPRLCNGENMSQDTVVSGATDSGLCSASLEGGDRERDVMVGSSDQETILVVARHLFWTLSMRRLLARVRTIGQCGNLADVDCASEASVPNKDLLEVSSAFRSCFETESSVEFSDSSIVPVDLSERDIQYDANILPGSEQTQLIATPSILIGICNTHCIENAEANDGQKLFQNNMGARQIDNLDSNDEFGDFADISDVGEQLICAI